MNFLLRDLKQSGIMRHDCLAFNERHLIDHMLKAAPGRAIMHMGDKVRPGPYWAVHADDVPALVAAGYRVERESAA